MMGSHEKKLSMGSEMIRYRCSKDHSNYCVPWVLAVTSGMSLSAVKGTVGPREWGWGNIGREARAQGVCGPLCQVHVL